ncbi:helix-turn-helix transcriptional regulator [Nocardia sp. NPDC051570]|uniref:helix-turn-helix transcriptional regulator n=1 Tax=Nocardia sp. NPDC051570 TaxID=3364324 RepID=UPI00378750EA
MPASLRSGQGAVESGLPQQIRNAVARTVQEWILQRRMTEARRLLADTTLPIAEIARRVGLPDPGYFTRQFRHTYGLPPRTWRTTSPA